MEENCFDEQPVFLPENSENEKLSALLDLSKQELAFSVYSSKGTDIDKANIEFWRGRVSGLTSAINNRKGDCNVTI